MSPMQNSRNQPYANQDEFRSQTHFNTFIQPTEIFFQNFHRGGELCEAASPINQHQRKNTHKTQFTNKEKEKIFDTEDSNYGGTKQPQIIVNQNFQEVILGQTKPLQKQMGERYSSKFPKPILQSIFPDQLLRYDQTQSSNLLKPPFFPEEPPINEVSNKQGDLASQSDSKPKQKLFVKRIGSANQFKVGLNHQDKFLQQYIRNRVFRAYQDVNPRSHNSEAEIPTENLVTTDKIKEEGYSGVVPCSIHYPPKVSNKKSADRFIGQKRNSSTVVKKQETHSQKQMIFKQARITKPSLQVSEEELQPHSKYLLYKQFMIGLNISNNLIIVTQDGTVPNYKAIITKGNNGIIVRNCLKNRWWWTLVDKDTPLEDVNLIWNQNRKLEFFQLLPKQQDLENSQLWWEQISIQQGGLPSPKHIEDKPKPCKRGKTNTQPEELVKLFTHCLSQKQYQHFIQTVSQANIKSQSQRQCLFDSGNIAEVTLLTRLFNPDIENSIIINQPFMLKSHNHLEKNFQITNKKALFYNISNYYAQQQKNPFEYIPLTFHIQKGSQDPEFGRFEQIFQERQQTNDPNYVNLWIIKPGENTNRGNGIEVSSSLSEIRKMVSTREFRRGGKLKTYIIQEYIQKPLLYNKRKFDIRCFMLITSTNEIVKGYWFQEGYIRTSSREFSTKNLENKMIHLTNDAVQKKGEEYGKYESGNKVSFADFHKYLEQQNREPKINFKADIVPNLKLLARDVIGCGYRLMDPKKRLHTFELFGLDFMIDENLKPWLIEVNNNPCLETSCSLLNRIIPQVVEQVCRIAIDPVFPPPAKFPKSKYRHFADNYTEQNRFELIFDSLEDDKLLKAMVGEKLYVPSDLLDDDDEIDGDD